MTTVEADSLRARPAERSAGLARRIFLGRPGDPPWARPGLWAVLLLAGLLYVWNLGAVGYANSYYSAAVLSGTKSWKAFFFGALDSGSFITVDKPPVALWVMGISARIFGFSTWSMMLPQAAAGIAAIGVLFTMVRRAFAGMLGSAGAAFAALVAALVMALTPITVAINRDNNPDTILVLLLVLAAWALQRAIELDRLRWLVVSAVLVGFAFNTKMLQAFLVLPAFALVYLVAAKPRFWRRIGHLLAFGAALAVSAGWWMVTVDLIPAGSRPFIGSSTKNSVWDLVIGYNGLGRVFGGDHNRGGSARAAAGAAARETGRQFQAGGSFGGPSFGGNSGAGRLFNDTVGGQISWLIPFAALALVVGIVVIGRRSRTDLARAALLLWGGWLAVHYVIFSFSQGTFHPYYTTTMAPAIGALVGAGGVLMLRAPARRWAWALPLAVAISGGWAFVLLRRTPSWNPWLAWAVLALTVAAAAALLAVRLASGGVLLRRLGIGAIVAALVGVLAGPAAYAVTPLSPGATGDRMGGTNPLAGPSSSKDPFGGRGWRAPGGFPGGLPNGQIPGGALPPGMSGGGFRGGGAAPGGPAAGFTGMGRGGPGSQVSTQMIDYLVRNQGGATWLVAVSSSMTADPIILKTGKAVMAMGGFSGGDPAMTVAKLQQYIKSGKLHYVLTGGGRGFGPDGGDSAITQWVTKNCTAISPAQYGDGSNTTGQALYRCT